MTDETPALRCMLQQIALPKYRLPFYRGLSERPGIDLLVVYGEANLPNVAPEGIRSHKRIVRRLPGGLMWDGEHLRLIRSGDFDATSLSWNVRFLSLFPAMIAARRRGVGTAVWGHGYSKREGAFRAWLRLVAARRADAVVTYTHTVREMYVRKGIDPAKIFVAQNCIDQAPIAAARAPWVADRARLDAFRAEHGLAGPVLLFVSRLERANRVDLLLEATATLRAEFPGLTAVVIGDGEEMADLRARAERLGLGDGARFLGAVYDEAQLAPWFCAASCFVYPSNIGLSILHAMGYGLPVITSDDIESQNPEIEALRPGENGLLYPRGDVGAMVGSIRSLLTDETRRSRMGAEALRTATEVYTIPRMVDGMEHALRHAAAAAAARRSRSR